ncbi:hypothetical protein FIBSPDRAFT_967310 [Athelia psychrophila]|uniref:DUF6534 domain-containing protein n=1 Tax=Athelia psychrophila TaxID=1759441 RepID=A0A167VUL0_9AGAM|nr:hypothetical protein FIBSPDRAFT_967310 [Fibularhizoctonia sp. CBS 109695]
MALSDRHLSGSILSLILFGVCLSQALTYCRNCKGDRLWVKLFVGMLVILDVSTSVITAAWMYRLFIKNHGDISMLAKADPLGAAVDVVIGFTQCAVQLFFAWRLHIIGTTLYPELTQPASAFTLRDFIIAKQHWLTAFICVASFLTLVGDVGTGLASLWVDYAHLASIAPIALTSGFASIVADVFITVAMTYHLQRAKGTFVRADRLLGRIIQLTLQNGCLTTLTAVVDVTLYLSTPEPYFIAGTLVLPKLYVNSALSSLNARKHLRRPANATMEVGERSLIELSDFH